MTVFYVLLKLNNEMHMINRLGNRLFVLHKCWSPWLRSQGPRVLKDQMLQMLFWMVPTVSCFPEKLQRVTILWSVLEPWPISAKKQKPHCGTNNFSPISFARLVTISKFIMLPDSFNNDSDITVHSLIFFRVFFYINQFFNNNFTGNPTS